MKVMECTARQVPAAAELFNAYRMFYRQESDLPSCHAFIRANVENRRSRLFLLLDEADKAVGLCQLYPSFCSISLKPYYYLSDLFVDPSSRQSGHARYLMNAVTERCRAEGAQRLTLDTATDNRIAQHLYESLGYQQERQFITYHQLLDRPGSL